MNQNFITAIQEANTVLLNTPECIEMSQDGNVIRWNYTSTAVKKARTTIKSILTALWQDGAFNYDQFARALRVDTRTIQALIDEQFIEKHGL